MKFEILVDESKQAIRINDLRNYHQLVEEYS